MRFDPNKLRLWLPVLTGTFAAVFLVCCDQLGGRIHPAAAASTVVQAPAPVVPAKATATAPNALSESPSAPVAELRPVEAPVPVRQSTTRHSSSRKSRRTRAVPTVEEPIAAAATSSAQDSALPVAAAASLPTPTPATLSASDSLVTAKAMAESKVEVDSAAAPAPATGASDSALAAPLPALPASIPEKPAPAVQETSQQPADPARTSMLLPEGIRPQ
jgi:hypothetical protein